MPKIHVLDKAVAELIAAGEVVERPASIVKELIENAVDAGSTAVTVEIRGGGVRYIRISDNGCGIDREDIPKAFLRHATSKVRTADDLAGINTLGFRGEALASIAAMCRVELTTKTAEEAEGTVYRVEGGETLETAPAGCPAGTTIIVRDVFFNTPARMKFLKRDTSEGNSVAQVVDKCALSHPEVAFRFIRDNQTKLRTSGNGDLLSVIRAIYGRELSESLLTVDYHYENRVHISGYISKPGAAKPSRTYQNFFINGRYVRTRTASAALEEAFKNKLAGGKFPACVLNLEIQAETVDVNVHPAKIEVRFADEKPIFRAVYFGVKSALAAEETPVAERITIPPEPARPPKVDAITMHLPQQEYTQQRMTAQEFRVLFDDDIKPGNTFSRPVSMHSPNLDISVTEDVPAPTSRPAAADKPFSDKIPPVVSGTMIGTDAAIPRENDTIKDKPMPVPPEAEEAPQPEPPAEEEPVDARLIGELFGTYILLERGDDLLLVDKHAAHERILYEQLRENLSYGNRQVLLEPKTIVLDREDYDAVLNGLDRLEAMGFGVEDFGDATVIVRETPIELGQKDIPFIIGEIAEKLRAGRQDLTPEALDRLYYSIACRSAIKAHDRNHAVELAELVDKLRRNPEITHCPHGRPVTVKLSRRQVEKLFGRIV